MTPTVEAIINGAFSRPFAGDLFATLLVPLPIFVDEGFQNLHSLDCRS